MSKPKAKQPDTSLVVRWLLDFLLLSDRARSGYTPHGLFMRAVKPGTTRRAC
jgi:hypothetical protein